LLETLTIREGKRTGERLVELVTSDVQRCRYRGEEVEVSVVVADFRQTVLAIGPEVGVDALYWTRRCAARGQRTRYESTLLDGSPVLRERLEIADGRSLRFEIHPRAFFQPNTLQAEVLYSEVIEASGLKSRRVGRVLDLYCGTGTIGLCLAHRADQVVGIELVAEAVENARRNAALNGIDNVVFHQGDVAQVLESEGLVDAGAVDLLVVDPPRNGLTPAALELVAKLDVPRVVYVSCTPRSLARDLSVLCRHGYRLRRVRPVDMFPHTWHVETVAVLDR
jgi:23S rRNA (uracil1939-C5)-methyltransferase